MTVDASWLKTARAQAEADEKELRRLTAERDHVEEKIKAVSERVRSWRVILDSTNGSGERGPARRPPATGAAEGAAEQPQGVGLRAAIREILSAAPGGLRPRDVTARLKARNFSLPGTTNTTLAVRVGAELWKMKQIGQLRKNRGGYMLVKPESERPETA